MVEYVYASLITYTIINNPLTRFKYLLFMNNTFSE